MWLCFLPRLVGADGKRKNGRGRIRKADISAPIPIPVGEINQFSDDLTSALAAAWERSRNIGSAPILSLNSNEYTYSLSSDFDRNILKWVDSIDEEDRPAITRSLFSEGKSDSKPNSEDNLILLTQGAELAAAAAGPDDSNLEFEGLDKENPTTNHGTIPRKDPIAEAMERRKREIISMRHGKLEGHEITPIKIDYHKPPALKTPSAESDDADQNSNRLDSKMPSHYLSPPQESHINRWLSRVKSGVPEEKSTNTEIVNENSGLGQNKAEPNGLMRRGAPRDVTGRRYPSHSQHNSFHGSAETKKDEDQTQTFAANHARSHPRSIGDLEIDPLFAPRTWAATQAARTKACDQGSETEHVHAGFDMLRKANPSMSQASENNQIEDCAHETNRGQAQHLEPVQNRSEGRWVSGSLRQSQETRSAGSAPNNMGSKSPPVAPKLQFSPSATGGLLGNYQTGATPQDNEIEQEPVPAAASEHTRNRLNGDQAADSSEASASQFDQDAIRAEHYAFTLAKLEGRAYLPSTPLIDRSRNHRARVENPSPPLRLSRALELIYGENLEQFGVNNVSECTRQDTMLYHPGPRPLIPRRPVPKRSVPKRSAPERVIPHHEEPRLF